MVPSRYAASDELVGIGAALGDVGAGAFGMNSDFDDEDAETRVDDADSPRNRPSGLVSAGLTVRGSGTVAAAVGLRCTRRAPRARI